MERMDQALAKKLKISLAILAPLALIAVLVVIAIDSNIHISWGDIFASSPSSNLPGRIWGRAWEDANGNQILDPGERYIRQAGIACDNANTTPVDLQIKGQGPVSFAIQPRNCVSGPPAFTYFDTDVVLPAGDYQFSITAPTPGWTLTTPQNKTVRVNAGEASFEWIGLRRTGVAEQLDNAGWSYREVLRPQDIPLPASLQGTPARVVSIYSPSVTKFEGKWIMVFGVSLYCNPNSFAAKDSLAIADSSDGVNWTFRKYLVEPDLRTCTLDIPNWPDGLLVNVNDPSVFIQDPLIERGVFYVLYSAVEWYRPNTECGNIGIASFDASYNPRPGTRNDRYFSGISDCNIGSSGAAGNGYGRPDLQWLDQFSTRLWFDGFDGEYSSVPVTRLDQLPPQTPRVELRGAGSGDLNVPRLSYADTVLLQTGVAGLANGIVGRSRPMNGGATSWSTPRSVTTLTGQAWDGWHHSSPHLALDTVACRPMLLFAGMRHGTILGLDVPIGSIGMATPAAGRVFSFPLCGN